MGSKCKDPNDLSRESETAVFFQVISKMLLPETRPDQKDLFRALDRLRHLMKEFVRVFQVFRRVTGVVADLPAVEHSLLRPFPFDMEPFHAVSLDP